MDRNYRDEDVTGEAPEYGYEHEDEGARQGSFLSSLSTVFVPQAVARILCSPVDRVKMLVQVEPELIRQQRLKSFRFNGAIGALSYLFDESAIHFFRGTPVYVAAVVPGILGQMFVGFPLQQMVIANMLGDVDEQRHSVAQRPLYVSTTTFIASLVGAVGVSIVSYPFEILRIKLMCDVCNPLGERGRGTYQYTDSLDVMRKLSTTEPASAYLYRGLGILIAGSVIYRAGYLLAANFVTRYLSGDSDSDVHAMMMLFSIFSSAEMLAYPFDTVRRRYVMALGYGKDARMGYLSALDCFRSVLRYEGVRGLYRGCCFNLVRASHSTVVTMVVAHYLSP